MKTLSFVSALIPALMLLAYETGFSADNHAADHASHAAPMQHAAGAFHPAGNSHPGMDIHPAANMHPSEGLHPAVGLHPVQSMGVQHPNQNIHNNNGNHNHQGQGYFPGVLFPFAYVPVVDDSSAYIAPEDDSNYSSYSNATPPTEDDSAAPSADTSQIPNGNWVPENNGTVPDGAIVYQNSGNNSEAYYCRVNYNDQLYYGLLYTGNGCYVSINSQPVHFSIYDALVAP